LTADQPVVLDASAVERMSTPCLQILLAKARAVSAQGGSFQIVAASPAFLTALTDIGVEPEFKNWIK
jgi:anti-anti-sigma regulatory factor